jgi:GH35 family endo-1,4-beta-xylanase
MNVSRLQRILVAATTMLGCSHSSLQGANKDNKLELQFRNLLEVENILPSDTKDGFYMFGKASSDAVMKKVKVDDNELFKDALQVEVKKTPLRSFHIEVGLVADKSVKAGDNLLLTFYVKTINSTRKDQLGYFDVRFRKKTRPWTNYGNMQFFAGSYWKKIYLPFTMPKNKTGSYDKDDIHVDFRFGHAQPQTVQIANVKCFNYGSKVELNNLPKTMITYEGREADAEWRTKAFERIKKLRKNDLLIEVVNDKGEAVTNAEVNVEMTKHAFSFGVMDYANYIVDEKNRISGTAPKMSKENLKRYQHEMEKWKFSRVVLGDDLKWRCWESKRREQTIKAIEKLISQNKEVRGHCLIWPSWKKSLPNLKKLKDEPIRLKKAIDDHIADQAGILRGKVAEWDVMNEPYSNFDIIDILGRKEMVEWYKNTHKVDPSAKLFINDYDILASQSNLTHEHQAHYEKTIKYLLDEKAPLQGIGMQCHFGPLPTPPKILLETLDRFGKFNIPIVITEYDHNVSDVELQGDYMRDFLITIFSHPSVSSFVTWGFWDGAHWIKNAPFYNKDWTLKPSGKAYKDLVLNKWWTREDGSVDDKGIFKTRGFLGDYIITINNGGETYKKNITLSKRENRFKIVL